MTEHEIETARWCAQRILKADTRRPWSERGAAFEFLKATKAAGSQPSKQIAERLREAYREYKRTYIPGLHPHQDVIE